MFDRHRLNFKLHDANGVQVLAEPSPARCIDGERNKQIAAELSENTIKTHRHRIMERMRAANVAAPVRRIERIG